MEESKMPYRLGTLAREKRWQEIREKEIKPVEVNCFGTKDFEIIRTGIIVKIFNEKIGQYQECVGLEYEDICPVCGTFMIVRAIKGTTWTAVCSKKCFKVYMKEWKETMQS